MNFATRSQPETGCEPPYERYPTVRIRDDIFYEETLKRSHVSLLRGSNKGLKEPTLLFGTDRCTTPVRNVFAHCRSRNESGREVNQDGMNVLRREHP
jgi:hypothetical protein